MSRAARQHNIVVRYYKCCVGQCVLSESRTVLGYSQVETMDIFRAPGVVLGD